MGRKPTPRDSLHGSAGPSHDGTCPSRRQPRRRTSRAMRDNREDRRKSSKRRENVSSEEILPEGSLPQDPGYDADVEIVRPYAIEEPDDDPEQTPTSKTSTPKLLDSTGYWQTELVNSMRGLYCDSDSTDAVPLTRHKRGRKRKNKSRAASQSYHEDDAFTSPNKIRKGSGSAKFRSIFAAGGEQPVTDLQSSNATEPAQSNNDGPMDID